MPHPIWIEPADSRKPGFKPGADYQEIVDFIRPRRYGFRQWSAAEMSQFSVGQR